MADTGYDQLPVYRNPMHPDGSGHGGGGGGVGGGSGTGKGVYRPLLHPAGEGGGDGTFDYPRHHESDAGPVPAGWRDKLWRWRLTACSVTTTILIGIALAIGIFVGGGAYAQAAMRDAVIDLHMTVQATSATTLEASLVASIDNRCLVGATMESTTLAIHYQGAEVGTVLFPTVHLLGGSLTMVNTSSSLTVTNQTAFSAFAVASLQKTAINVTLHGSVDVHSMGITFHGIVLDKTVQLTGVGGFQNPAPVIVSQIFGPGLEDRLAAKVTVQVQNPSSVALHNAGKLVMGLWAKGVQIGTASSEDDVSFFFGTNTQTWKLWIIRTSPLVSSVIDEVMSNYSVGAISHLSMRGTRDSTNVTVLQEAMSQLRIDIQCPGLVHYEAKLIAGAYALLNVSQVLYVPDPTACPTSLGNSYVDIYIMGRNVYNATLQLTGADLKVYWSNERSQGPLAFVNKDDLDVHIAPGGITVFRQRTCVENLGLLLNMVNYCANTLHVDPNAVVPFTLMFDIEGLVTGTFDEFAGVHLTYAQEDVLGTLRLLQVQE